MLKLPNKGKRHGQTIQRRNRKVKNPLLIIEEVVVKIRYVEKVLSINHLFVTNLPLSFDTSKD